MSNFQSLLDQLKEGMEYKGATVKWQRTSDKYVVFGHAVVSGTLFEFWVTMNQMERMDEHDEFVEGNTGYYYIITNADKKDHLVRYSGNSSGMGRSALSHITNI